tara:strand:+ start:139 stop:327 length:189 start_codon:yes stop_codon:yes gene_type:complete
MTEMEKAKTMKPIWKFTVIPFLVGVIVRIAGVQIPNAVLWAMLGTGAALWAWSTWHDWRRER